MSIKFGTAAGAALFAFVVLLVPALAANITEREKRDCPNDYHKYCGEYGLGSEALRACMSRNIKKLSRVCVAALVDAGELSQAQADKLHGKAAAATKKKTTAKKTTGKKKVAYKGKSSKGSKTSKTSKKAVHTTTKKTAQKTTTKKPH
jgi:hypothetical protein